MDWKLELIILPVADVDRSKAFYEEQAGFHCDGDHRAGDHFRVVQMTPPGSACSISFGIGISSAEPGSVKGMHLVVPDIEAARDELRGRGTETGEIFHFGEKGRADGPHPTRESYGSFLSFDDPDGNTWVVQEVRRDADGRPV